MPSVASRPPALGPVYSAPAPTTSSTCAAGSPSAFAAARPWCTWRRSPTPTSPELRRRTTRRINYDGAVNVFAGGAGGGCAEVRLRVLGPGLQDQRSRPDRSVPDPGDELPALAGGGAELLQRAEGGVRAPPPGAASTAALRPSRSARVSGVRSDAAMNLFASTSIENTVAGFARAIEAELYTRSGVQPGRWRDRSRAVDVQAFLAEQWPRCPTTRAAMSRS